MLQQRAPEGHVHQLVPPPDAEDRQAQLERRLHEGQLEVVAVGVDAVDLGIGGWRYRLGSMSPPPVTSRPSRPSSVAATIDGSSTGSTTGTPPASTTPSTWSRWVDSTLRPSWC